MGKTLTGYQPCQKFTGFRHQLYFYYDLQTGNMEEIKQVGAGKGSHTIELPLFQCEQFLLFQF